MARIKMLDKAIKSAGGMDEFNRKFNEYCKNDEYFHGHRTEWLNSYDGKWIAIYNSKFEASGDSWKDIMNKIKSKGLPSDEVLVQFVSSKPKILIL
jgi:hypothetical protein